MTIDPRVWDFPAIPISKQIFYVPGMVAEGGYTSGGARITSPEPGGFAMLEIQPSWQEEWSTPFSSWLMSKTNGQILRVQLAPTPQVASSAGRSAMRPDHMDLPVSQGQFDLVSTFAAASLEGSNQVTIEMDGIGQLLAFGHVIGHAYETYLIDEIEYVGTNAVATVMPPLRRDIAIGDPALFRPYFTGQIINGGDIRASYDAENRGMVQPGKIILTEVIVP